MPGDGLKEDPLQFGAGGRLFGVLTTPAEGSRHANVLPVFVFLSAGLLHRVGPLRLHVRLAREIVRSGFASLRIDLAGKGDSPARTGFTNQQSVAVDFEEILSGLEGRLGPVSLVLAGLCSGADNAIRLAAREPRVVGMVLLDPICFPDRNFAARAVYQKYTNRARYALWLRRIAGLTDPGEQKRSNPLALRDLPSRVQMREAFEAVRRRNGQVLSVFTQYALGYYNRPGQLGSVLEVADYSDFCTERFWPDSEHTYRTEAHRRRLMDEIKSWASRYWTSRSGTVNERK